MGAIQWVPPGAYRPEEHFYPRVPNARLHSLVRSFLRLSNERVAIRYCHLHPAANRDAVLSLLQTPTRYLRWAGADLFHVSDDRGARYNVLIETNSSPSGQKSMPLLDDADEAGGYRALLERSFLPMLKRRALPKGRLAVLWDKNEMETGAYAAVLADLTGEEVALVHVPRGSDVVASRKGVLHLRQGDEEVPVRAAFRYVTQQPWTRIPPLTRTALLNPVLGCLAGGRNKALAAKAYDLFNAANRAVGLRIRTPETIWDVSHDEVPLWVERMGGVAVVKNPYSNAGQGVWTITSPAELDAFMALDQRYDRFIVQGLVGNLGWTSQTGAGKLYHVGTVPDRQGRIFVADLRVMVAAGPDGFAPVAMYARRAREPLAQVLDGSATSWEMLGTNLSKALGGGRFTTEPDRLMLMDERDFNRLGIGIDDLVEGYLQTVMAIHAIDAMARRLVNAKGRFRRRLFASLNPDPRLVNEVMP